MTQRMSARVAELTTARIPFVHATVVRSQEPSSARAGDDAVILADGSIEGFVGGRCAESSVRTAALDVLGDGQSLLLRVLPPDAGEYPPAPRARTVVNSCHSGGALEIYLEPSLPAPVIGLVGRTPITAALQALGGLLGFVCQELADGVSAAGATAVVVATHGHDEPAALRAALDAGVPYVGLVASPRRGAVVLAELDPSQEERARLHSPVGLDIGARTPEEIALSVLAELVLAIRREGLRASTTGGAPAPAQALDPVCGMTVVVGSDTPTHVGAEGTHWFCADGCRDSWAATHLLAAAQVPG
jgi:xanthine dehydrogenase accessory factor